MSYKEPPIAARGRRILRRAEVEQKTGFKRAHLYALMKVGQFPQCVRLGVRAVGWDSLEVEQWITQRLRERAGPAAAQAPPASPPRDSRARRHATRSR